MKSPTEVAGSAELKLESSFVPTAGGKRRMLLRHTLCWTRWARNRAPAVDMGVCFEGSVL